jgi:multidrug efflux pump subunit AcrA (membrane-fusion protein)
VRRVPVWAALGAIAIAVVAIVIWNRSRASAPAPQSDAAPAVALATVKRGEYAVTLREAGHVGAPAGTTTKATFAVSGILSSVPVHVGEYVRAGTPIAQLDTRALALDAQQARAEAAAAAASYAGGSVPAAQLSGAQANVRAAQQRASADLAQVEREQRLYHAGVAALKDVQAAQAQLAADRAAATVAQADARAAASQPQVLAAQAQAAQARAAAAENSLALGTLTAPVDGIVTAIYKRPGEAVDTTTPVLAIGPAQQNVATLDVPGTDAQQISNGNPVTLSITGLAQTGQGVVTAVVPSVDPTTQSATVVVNGIPSGAVAGSAVQARIVVAHVSGVLIPQSAIVQDPQSGDALVFVQQRQKDGTLKFAQRTVVVKHEDGTTAEIASGVQPGERIAAQGAFSLLAPSGGGD